jgi:hypothetical protein
MIKKVIVYLVMMIMLSGYATATESDYFVLTEAGSNARMIRIGNVEGFSPLSSSVFENPAGLYRVYKFSSSMFTTTFMGELKYQNVSVSYRLPMGILGLGYMKLGVDGLESTMKNDSNKISSVGSFNYENSMAKAVYQVSIFENLHVGAGLSYYSTTLDEVKGGGMNFDVGAIIGSESFQGSLAFKNIMSSMSVDYTDDTDYSAHTELTQEEKDEQSSDGKVENLPFIMVMSVKKTYKNFVFFAQHKAIENHQDAAKSYGVEYTPKFLSIFKVSAASKKYPVVRSVEGETKRELDKTLVLGLGLDLFGVSFDYAHETINDHSEYKGRHYFSIGYSF